MAPSKQDGRRKSPRKRDTANNENNERNADEHESSDLKMSLKLNGAFPSISGVKPKPPPSKFNMTGQFGGPCFDTAAKIWKKSLPVEADGTIIAAGSSEYAQARHLAQAPQQVHAALRHIGKIALTTGKIFITVLRERSPRGHQLEEVAGIMMSGFWLDNTKFVTAAHFPQVLDRIHADETEKFLKVANPQKPRAFVSNSRMASDSLSPYNPDSWPVHLLRLSRTSDIAIFELTQAVRQGPSGPTHSISLHDLSSTLTTTTPEQNECQKDYLYLFAAYYPLHDPDVNQCSVSEQRKQFARDSRLSTAWQLFSVESLQANPETPEGPPDFVHTFTPSTRSVAFGHVQPNSHEGTHPQPCHDTSGNSLFARTCDCNIVGTWGCSGGMIGHLYREGSAWKSKIVGIYRGESPTNPQNNQIVAFTPAFIKAIQEGTFWDTG